MRRLSGGARVKDESLKQELLEGEGTVAKLDEKGWEQHDVEVAEVARKDSSVTVFVPTQSRSAGNVHLTVCCEFLLTRPSYTLQ